MAKGLQDTSSSLAGRSALSSLIKGPIRMSSLLRKNSIFSSLLGLAATTSLVLVGCADDGGGGGIDPIVIDDTGTHNKYVVSDLTIPASATESKALALDLDGDGETENALGGLLGALAKTADLDLQTGVDEQIAEASIILLASIKATDPVNASGVGTYIYFGENAMPTACTDPLEIATCGKHLDGNGTFDIAANTPADSVLAGTLAGGDLVTQAGTISIELPLGDTAPLQITLIGAQVQATVSATGLSAGIIGGAITETDVDTKVIPSVQVLVADIIAEDCPGAAPGACNCMDGSAGESVLSFFDTNKDCAVPVLELMENSLIEATLRNPDLDLLDANGDYNPNSDNVNDSLSLAIGFAAVSGAFTVPVGD